jgi:Spy/CpxP family protein refolding chaperone
MRKLSAILVAGALLAPAALAAQRPPAGPPPDRPMRMHAPPDGRGMMGPGQRQGMFNPQMLLNRRQRLELTDDQVKQLEALATASREANEKAATDAKPHVEKLQELWNADQPDPAAIQTEMRAVMQAHQTAGLTALANTAKAKGLLTAEQRGRVEGWADRGRMGARRFNGGPGWNGGPRQGNGYQRMRRF